jgi:ribosomal protein S18 acetylase RimI-like enzyme
MEPWADYGMTADQLARFLSAEEPDCSRRAIRLGEDLAGVIVVRSPWLHGPYLQFLGVLPAWQGLGLGQAALAWLAAEAPAGTRNLWLCVSAFNTRALTFYQRNGFEPAATLAALAADHVDEILMRRALAPVLRSAH